MKKPNVKVLFNKILTTTNRQMFTESGIAIPDGATLLTKQTVVAAGDNASVNVGDEVELDTSQFPREEVDAKHDIGPSTYNVIPPTEQIGGELYLTLTDRAVKWIYNKGELMIDDE